MAFTCREIDRSSRRFVAAEAGGRRAESPESPYRPSDVDNLIGASRRSSFSLFFFLLFFPLFVPLFISLGGGARFCCFFFSSVRLFFLFFSITKKKKEKKKEKETEPPQLPLRPPSWPKSNWERKRSDSNNLNDDEYGWQRLGELSSTISSETSRKSSWRIDDSVLDLVEKPKGSTLDVRQIRKLATAGASCKNFFVDRGKDEIGKKKRKKNTEFIGHFRESTPLTWQQRLWFGLRFFSFVFFFFAFASRPSIDRRIVRVLFYCRPFPGHWLRRSG